MTTTPHTPRCIARHSGLWCVNAEWFQTTWAAVRAGSYPILAAEDAEARSVPYSAITEDGIGLIAIDGPMMKGASKFGNTDTVQVRQAVRTMMADPKVRGVVIRADSPGGTFDGTDELHDDIAALAKEKPVYTQVEGLGASALVYAVAGSTAQFATRTSQYGSLGTMAVIEDSSKAAEMAGVKVHVLSTGEFKGAGAEGAPITDGTLDYLRERLQTANGFFRDAVKKGRGLTEKKVDQVWDGRTWFAADALALGLIDGVQGMDDTINALRVEIKTREKAAKASARMGMARLRG